jgi:hypothetical protein
MLAKGSAGFDLVPRNANVHDALLPKKAPVGRGRSL